MRDKLNMSIPGDWPISPFGVRAGKSGIAVKLPKKGKSLPPLEAAMFVAPASQNTPPEKVLRSFLLKAGPRRSFNTTTAPPTAFGPKFLWLESRQKKGSRIVAGILRRPQPAYPGLTLESPHNISAPEDDPQEPRYYIPVTQLTRVPGDLDYIIMIEGAPAAFEKSRQDLESFLRNLVIE